MHKTYVAVSITIAITHKIKQTIKLIMMMYRVCNPTVGTTPFLKYIYPMDFFFLPVIIVTFATFRSSPKRKVYQ